MSVVVRREPCAACPYRCDVPSGVWAAPEYEKLRAYDAPTAEQPFGAFACHATPDHVCHGWAVVHGRDPVPGHELIALRLLGVHEVEIEPTVPLFTSGAEAADHGERDIEHPSQQAIEMASRLGRKYDRLSWE